MTINYDLENSNLDFRFVFLVFRPDYDVCSIDDSAVSDNTKEHFNKITPSKIYRFIVVPTLFVLYITNSSLQEALER